MVQVAGIEINRGEWKRITLWSFWTFNMILNFVYMCLTFATSSNLISQASKLHVQFSNTTWRAPIASCILGGIMVLMFNIMTCVILIRKSINKSGPGFGFGFIMAWCFVMAFFMMLCGLVLDSFSLTVEQVLEPQTNWSKYDTGSYYGTIAFAFINCIMFLFFFICLAIFQGGITKQLGMFDPRTDEKRKLEAALAARGATMAMPQAQTQMSPINPLAGTANYGPATRI